MDRIKSTTSNRTITCTPIQLSDMYCFIGTLYIMDVYQLAEIKMYWGYGNSLIKIDAIANNMDYNKFVNLQNSMGVVEKNTIFQLVCNRYLLLIKRSRQLAIDKQSKLFKGRYNGKVVKAYLVGDSNTKLPIRYSIEGKGKNNDVISIMNIYSSVAASMVTPYPNVILFVDNLYTTHELHKYYQSSCLVLFVLTICPKDSRHFI